MSHPLDSSTETRTTQKVDTELFEAVRLILDRLKQRHHVFITDKLLYRSENKWHIDDIEQQPIVSMDSVKEAAIYFSMLEGPKTVVSALGGITISDEPLRDDEIIITIEE